MRTPGRVTLGSALSWLRAHDPELAATRRALRTAIVMPALFALCGQLIGSPTTATYAAFGSFSMLLLVDFTGPMVQRLQAHAGLAMAWAVLICLGTLVAHRIWLAVTVMVVIGFLVLFAGAISSVLAGASTALLLAFILPVTSPAPLSQLPDRLMRRGAGDGRGDARRLPAVAPAHRGPAQRARGTGLPRRRGTAAGRRVLAGRMAAARRTWASAASPPTAPPTPPPSCAASSTPRPIGPPVCPPAHAPSSVWSTN